MKGKFLRFRPAGINKQTGESYGSAFIYQVVGSSKEIEQFEENQDTYCRWLQKDGKITDEPSDKPVYYSTTPAGKNPELVWSEGNEEYPDGRYFAQMGYEDALISYNAMAPTTASQQEETVKEEEPELAPKPAAVRGRGRK